MSEGEYHLVNDDYIEFEWNDILNDSYIVQNIISQESEDEFWNKIDDYKVDSSEIIKYINNCRNSIFIIFNERFTWGSLC